MDTILFLKAKINGLPVQAIMRVPAPQVSDRELRIRLFWRWYELQQYEVERLLDAPAGAERRAA